MDKRGPTEVVGAIIVADGRILLGLRASHRRSCPNCWDVIGGHVESGETPVGALAREMKEEIGITPTAPKPFQVLAFNDEAEGPSRLHLYVVEQWQGTPTLTDDEHSELRWFNPREAAALPNLALEAYKIIFSQIEKMS